MKYLLFTILSVLFITPSPSFAQETHEVTYDFNFFIRESNDIDVELDISLKNLRSDIYIDEFSLTFPNNFFSGQLKVSNYAGEIPFSVDRYKTTSKVTFSFPEPATGKNSENSIRLLYTHKDLYTDKGNIFEAILPLITPDDNSIINATLHLPQKFDEKITISKPKPTSIEFNKIIWKNVNSQTILTQFGESQLYRVDLTYNLANNGFKKEHQDIALPPETLYQKIFITTLDPEPEFTYVDDDGNYMARYILNPREKQEIRFKGFVEVFVQPQETMRDYIRSKFNEQKKYLLTEVPYWKLGIFINKDDIKKLSNVQDVYNYVVNELSYSYDRLSEDISRFGAEKALDEPYMAVCMEFTDLFIALAREKGIYAREMQGFGYSERENIRPLSLVTDVLHSWPEYYSEAQEKWIPVDPTWEDTSGIDYFTAFDVNHIALAIHGKRPDVPMPAGFYKTESSRDVSISVSTDKPEEKQSIELSNTMDNIVAGTSRTAQIVATNTGTTFIHDLTLIPQSKNLTFENGGINVGLIAPFETKEVSFTYQAQSDAVGQDIVSFSYDGSVISEKAITITSRSGDVVVKIGGIVVGGLIIGGIFLLFKLRRKSS